MTESGDSPLASPPTSPASAATDEGTLPPDTSVNPSVHPAQQTNVASLSSTPEPVIPEPRRSAKNMQPVIGYNHNARHNGRMFHLQTEDSGTRYARIITQLFMDGGRIVKSVKTSYVEHLGDPRLSDIVREMMRQQHKAMFIALRDGTFDTVIGQAPGAGSAEKSADGEATERNVIDPDEDPPTLRQLPDELSLDLDALERAVEANNSAQRANVRPQSDLPPPPTDLLRSKAGVGLFRTLRESDPIQAIASPASVPAPSPEPPRSDRRYGVARPAAIFGPRGLSLGKAPVAPPLHDDQTLDAMILRYLSEDDP